MRITKEMIEPSRDDVVRMTRQEKMSMLVLAYIATCVDEVQAELKDRLQMITDGENRVRKLSAGVDDLLRDLRLTVPVNQRLNLQNTAMDYEIRLVPKMTPSKTSVVMQKEEFRELVDLARSKCRECMDDDQQCEKCGLYQLLTVLLPLDGYHDGLLCPYNLGEWAN